MKKILKFLPYIADDSFITLPLHKSNIPSLREMLARCDLNVERHPDLVSFEAAPPKGLEII
jgi:hypothetical protein